MSGNENNRPIIIKKKKAGHAGAHGGAWKVAYADFVTAMMAFFLLLWLLNATTEEQRRGIADYFAPMSVSKSNSGGGGVLAGTQIAREGAATSNMSQLAVPLPLPVPPDEETEGEYEGAGDQLQPATKAPETPSLAKLDGASLAKLTPDQIAKLSAGDKAKALAAVEERNFQQVEQQLRQAIQTVPELQPLKDSLVVDRTDEGLRIQIVDQEKYSMFPSGSAQMYDQTQRLLGLVAQAVAQMPQKLSVSGHTDAIPFRRSDGYGNWELSSDRANATRRAMMLAGIPESRFERVVGRADRDPLLADAPNSPRNRRISIVLLREQPLPPGAAPNAAANALGVAN
ncbi:MAG TPA: flagellar motor protein MotB [Alphaproteobacteria bacterium]|nr:flagellar motor protein MotB [Alphaproteobacteria bacterium]